jgi:hypothetical protein
MRTAVDATTCSRSGGLDARNGSFKPTDQNASGKSVACSATESSKAQSKLYRPRSWSRSSEIILGEEYPVPD